MARYRVTCATKHGQHTHILGLGAYSSDNVFLTFTEAQVIGGIEHHKDSFYVERPTGHVIDLEVVTRHDGSKYVKTRDDAEKPNNLLSLPNCPKKSPVITATGGALGSVVGAASHGPVRWWSKW